MKTTTFNASAESMLLLDAIAVGLGQGQQKRHDIALSRMLELGRQTGLTPWLFNVHSKESDDIKRLQCSYSTIYKIILEAQLKCAMEISSTLQKRNIRAPIFKGLAYALGCIRGEAIFNDVDFIVSAEDIAVVRETLAEIGYSQNIVSHDGQVQLIPHDEITRFESTHYELFPFTKIIHSPELNCKYEAIRQLGLTHPLVIEDGEIFIAVELDIHHNLSNGLDAAEILNFTIPVDSKDSMLHQLDWGTHAWFIAARLYHETMVLSSRKLRPLIDLGLIIGKTSIDWERVIKVSQKYALAPSLFYPFSWLADSFGIHIPPDVLMILERDRADQELHDFGDFVPKVLREDTLLRPSY